MMPKTALKLKEGLRIDFRTTKGEPLNYLRFEHSNCEDGIPTYIGSIDDTDREKLLKLRRAITYLLNRKKKKRRTPAPKANGEGK